MAADEARWSAVDEAATPDAAASRTAWFPGLVLMRAAGVRLEEVPGGSAAAQALLAAYFAELDARFDGGFDPGDPLRTAAAEFGPPSGKFLG